ncbi:MAG: RecB family exonuclease [Gaiella sp.]
MGLPVAQPERFVGPLRLVEPLRRLAPTGLHAFDECRLRGAWSAARMPPLLPSSPAARLGTVVHRLLEEAGRGALSSNSLDGRWQELVAETEQAMTQSALEARFVPLRETVPKYEVVRLRAEARAGELAQDLPDAGSRAAEAKASPYGYELRVESADGLIAGRIDRAVPAPAGPVLQDYKSGAIFSIRQGEGQQEIRPEYADQLRLYAALYYDSTGTWPSKLELVPLAGPPREIPLSTTASLNLLDKARSLLGAVNDELERGVNDWYAVEASLASPSPSACRFCAYRPACAAYLSSIDQEGDPDWPADVVGAFGALTRLGNGRLILSITLSDGSASFVRNITDRTVSAARLDTLEGGHPIAVFNLRRTKAAQAFEEGPLTMVYAGPQQDAEHLRRRA